MVRVIETEPMRNSCTCVMRSQKEVVDTKVLHYFELILGHRAERIIDMAIASGRLAQSPWPRRSARKRLQFASVKLDIRSSFCGSLAVIFRCSYWISFKLQFCPFHRHGGHSHI